MLKRDAVKYPVTAMPPEWWHVLWPDPMGCSASRMPTSRTRPFSSHQGGPMKSKHTFLITIGILVVTAAGSLAYAQTMQMPTAQGTTGCPMMGMMGQDGMPGMTGHGMMGPGSMAAQVEGRLA